MKIVVNSEFGGFSLSDAQMELLGVQSAYAYDKFRSDPRLVKSVEEGDTGGNWAKLRVVEFPLDAFFEINEYDGIETVIWSLSEIHYA